MIPEFIGRLPIIFTLDGLNEDMLVKILQEPKNAILKQYQKLLALDEVKLEFEDGGASCNCCESTGERYRCQGTSRDTGRVYAGYHV